MGVPYRTCPRCGANLDPGEPCDCARSDRAPGRRETPKTARAVPPERVKPYAIGAAPARGRDFVGNICIPRR